MLLRWIGLLVALALLAIAHPTQAAPLPPWLPRYDLDMRVDVQDHTVNVRQQVTWTNRHQRPSDELVFNVHSHYQVPANEVGFYAKTLEVLRLDPRDALDPKAQAFQLQRVTLGRPLTAPLTQPDTVLQAVWAGQTNTDLVVKLPFTVEPGQTVTVQLEFVMILPQKMGRWGQWECVTYLSNWLPVLAVYDECGWHPVPFVPWHQPFYNEAGIYTARVELPCDQKIATTGAVTAKRDLGNGWQQVEIVAQGVRDFAFLCSARYREWTTEVKVCDDRPPVKIKVCAFCEHEHYAQQMLQIAADVIPLYSKWFGPYPYPEFTIAEAFFGWNGNECSSLVMIDERVFQMPHMGSCYVEYLVGHEILHQWWYNMVGTNGYCETWMDEAIVTHFSHKVLTRKYGKNNKIINLPRGLEWMPNIHRQDYRSYGLYGTIGRGTHCQLVQEIPKFGHIVDLFNMIYDKGSRVVAMMEERLGEAAMFDLMRIVFKQYQYKILHIKEFQKELEGYTGQSWEEFFQNWLYGKGLTDWAVEKVEIERTSVGGLLHRRRPTVCPPEQVPHCVSRDNADQGPFEVTVLLHQKAEYDEQTTLGIALDKDDCYNIRIPILPQVPHLDLPDHNATVMLLPDHRVCVRLTLPRKPRQITVDPDQVLVDKNPANNFWRRPIRWRVSPVYTFLDETDLTCAFDRWNVTTGLYVNRPAYDNPWYNYSTLVGFRTGLYRTQWFHGGLYAAYRTDYRDVVIGADGVLDHCLHCNTQFGFHVEQRVGTFQNGDDTAFRASLFARYILKYGSSLYLPPMEYVEAFGAYQDNFLPFARQRAAGAVRPDDTSLLGLHYHKNYLTPYWDPVAGYQVDLSYAGGVVDLNGTRGVQQLWGQASYVQAVPDLRTSLPALGECGAHVDGFLNWLSDTRVALRFYGASGWPSQGEYFTLGGGNLFRGFDQEQRQGSAVFVGSVEWRVPLCRHVEWDVCDHVAGIRNVYTALFYDAGNAYVSGRQVGPVAHALGVGLRLDLAWFSFVERSTLRLDLAKTLNSNTGTQVWFGFQHPF